MLNLKLSSKKSLKHILFCRIKSSARNTINSELWAVEQGSQLLAVDNPMQDSKMCSRIYLVVAAEALVVSVDQCLVKI
jgi:hypothetical protein